MALAELMTGDAFGRLADDDVILPEMEPEQPRMSWRMAFLCAFVSFWVLSLGIIHIWEWLR